MDTTTKIMMAILEDFYGKDNGVLVESYQKYYEALNMEESRNVVKTALGRLQLENQNAKCELGEEQFRLEIPE